MIILFQGRIRLRIHVEPARMRSVFIIHFKEHSYHTCEIIVGIVHADTRSFAVEPHVFSGKSLGSFTEFLIGIIGQNSKVVHAGAVLFQPGLQRTGVGLDELPFDAERSTELGIIIQFRRLSVDRIVCNGASEILFRGPVREAVFISENLFGLFYIINDAANLKKSLDIEMRV